MLQFIFGFILGGLFGFSICAVCSMAGSAERTDFRYDKEIGDRDVESK